MVPGALPQATLCQPFGLMSITPRHIYRGRFANKRTMEIPLGIPPFANDFVVERDVFRANSMTGNFGQLLD